MPNEQELIETRVRKLARIRELGVEPYPHRYDLTHSIAQLSDGEPSDTGEPVRIAGRIMGLRGHGALIFADLEDASGEVQLLLSSDHLEEKQFSFLQLLDIGDFLGASGRIVRTKRGQLSVQVSSYDLLAKTLRPLPDKRRGIQDKELRYRRTSEFLVRNRPRRENFVKRAAAIQAIRDFLNARDFLEVETPVLQPIYGGAAAKPFVTHLNALDRDFFLSIAPELYLKRLIAGGYDRVYTICKNFRNESIDRIHNPEFTMMECYQAYADYNDMMLLVEDLYASVFERVTGSTSVEYVRKDGANGSVTLEFAPPWPRATMLDLVGEYTGLDVGSLEAEALHERLLSGAVDQSFFAAVVPKEELHEWSWGDLVQALFEHFVEDRLVQPTFVTDHPKETTPLCKTHRNDPRLIERFEPFVLGFEIGNAYSELNDATLQRTLLEQDVIRARLNDELDRQLDEEFCRAVELGLPPTGGLGLGIDRMIMLLTGAVTIKDVIFFPLMRT